MKRQYNKSPLIETLCEFRFDSSGAWDLTIPGLLYDKLKDDYPKKRPLKVFEANAKKDDTGSVCHELVTMERIQLLSDNEKNIIQIAPDQLIINQLQPYSDWKNFRDIILKALDAYKLIAQPKGHQKLSLNYINKFEWTEKKIELEDYFAFYPHVGPDLPEEHFSFITGIEAMINEFDILKMRIANSTDSKDSVRVILDINYFTSSPDRVLIDQEPSWLSTAHLGILDAFEGCLTDKLRHHIGVKE